MSDNVRPALYEADYSCTLASRPARPPSRALSRVVGKHCESGDIVVWTSSSRPTSRPATCSPFPGTGAYCRSLSSQYNHTPRPPVRRRAWTAAAASSCAARPSTTCSPSTSA